MNYTNKDIDHKELLIEKCEDLNIAIDGVTAKKLYTYIKLIHKWNRAYNLTAVKNMNSLIEKHIIDSLTIFKFLKASATLLDVGTGAGLPGIPLAIVNPQLNVHLLDSNGKKICFLRQAISDLSLNNVSLHNNRLDNFTNNINYDYIVTRAFSSLKMFYDGTKHLKTDNTTIIVMKGTYPAAEIEEMDDKNFSIEKISINNDIQRHIVIFPSNNKINNIDG